LLEQPPYIPDHDPREFLTFGAMIEALRGRGFSSDKEVVGGVQN